VVLMRLEKMGYAERDEAKPRKYAVDKNVPKKAMLIARQR
jgi:sugar-specific transcriptional regulator TrmB